MINIRNITPKEIEEHKQETIDRFSPYTDAELPISIRYISGNAYIQKEDIEGGDFYAGCSEERDDIGQIKFYDTMEAAVAGISSRKTVYDAEHKTYCEPFAGIACAMANGLITGYPLYAVVGDEPFDQKTYIANYNKENYDRIELKIPKGKKAEWKAKAKAEGLSLTEWITKQIEEKQNV